MEGQGWESYYVEPAAAPPGPGPASVPARGRRRGVAIGAAGALILVIALVVGFTATSGSGRPGHVAIAGDSFVAAAAQRTLAEKTAEVRLSGSVAVAGTTIPMTGSGLVDLTDQAMSLDVSADFTGHSMAFKELIGGRNLYLSMTLDGRDLSSMSGGRHWVDIPVPNAGPDLTGNPAAALVALSHQGATVTSLGTRQIQGSTCRGFQVIPDRQAMLAAAEQEFQAMGLTRAERQAAMTQVDTMNPPQIEVWFDPQGLTRQMGIDMSLGGVSSGSAVLTMTFIRYGVPVQISVPSPSDVMTYQQFMKMAGQQG